MGGWNVAATQLVAERVHHKISDFVHFTSSTIITVNYYDEHVERMLVGMYVVFTVYDK